jgi:hypothetical protein
VETAIESGLRWGELTELRPHDLQTRSRMLTLSRAVTETTATFNSTDGVRFGVKAYPKDKEYRRLKLPPTICTALAEHARSHGLKSGDLLFPLSLMSIGVADDAPPQLEQLGAPVGRTEPNAAGRTYLHATLTAYTLGSCRCQHCKNAFAAYRAARRAEGKDNPRTARTNASIDTDGHIPRRWFRHHIWQPATTAANLPFTVRFHDLRHAHAS